MSNRLCLSTPCDGKIYMVDERGNLASPVPADWAKTRVLCDYSSEAAVSIFLAWTVMSDSADLQWNEERKSDCK